MPTDEWIATLANGVDSTLTLGAWRAGHPGDTVSLRRPTSMEREPFCRSADASVTAASRVWRRSAVFVIPPPPPGEVLPDTHAVADRLCRLRALWFESVDDSLGAELAASKLQEELSRRLGAARSEILMSGPGADSWLATASWIKGPRVVVVGAHLGGEYQLPNDTATAVKPPTVIVLTYMIGNGIDTSEFAPARKRVYPKVHPEALVEMARADSAIGWSGLKGLVPLRKLFAHYLDSTRFNRGVPRTNPALDTVLVQALGALRDTMGLPPAQRSAAFLAIDIALRAHTRVLDRDRAATIFRQRLERLGARYEYYELGGGYFYLRPFLWRAYQADSLGAAGKSAFAELLADGWSQVFACREKSDRTGQVLGRGARALEAGLDDPMVHLSVAQAYADVFSLGPTSVPESASDSVRSLGEKSEMARLRAIEHFRQALPGVRDTGLRRTIWNNAVRLMLRRTIDTRYFCEPAD